MFYHIQKTITTNCEKQLNQFLHRILPQSYPRYSIDLGSYQLHTNTHPQCQILAPWNWTT